MFTNLFTFERVYMRKLVWMGMDIHTGMDRFSIICRFICKHFCLQEFLLLFYYYFKNSTINDII